MVEMLDERGRLFGLVNIVDLLVVLVVVAMIAAGWVLVAGDTAPEPRVNETTTAVTFETQDVEPYVATAIENGTVGGPDVVAVTSKTVEPATVVASDANGTLHVREHPRLQRVTLSLELNTTSRDGRVLFSNRGQPRPLRIGHQYTIAIRDVSINGTVTSIDG